jgi:hypothetical protein
MSVQEKRACIEAGQAELSIARQCELIGLPRASYYREITLSESEENLELMRLIDLTWGWAIRPRRKFIDSEENHVLRAWSEFNGFAS